MEDSPFKRNKAVITVICAGLVVTLVFLLWSITWTPLERRLAGEPPVGNTSLEAALGLDVVITAMLIFLCLGILFGYLTSCSEEGISMPTLSGRRCVPWEDVRRVRLGSPFPPRSAAYLTVEIETPLGTVQILMVYFKDADRALTEILRRVPPRALPHSSPS